MKPRSHSLAILALLFLSLPAAAQTPGVSRTRTATEAPSFGSFERSKLLGQACRRDSRDVLRLGAADRRALLTTGKPVHKRKPALRNRR